MRHIHINLSALLQGGIGSALVGACVLLWTTLSDLNRAVAKLDATVQVSNAAVTVLKEEIRDMKQQQKDQDRAIQKIQIRLGQMKPERE